VAVVLVLILALGYLSRPTSPVRELPAAETDVYSGYRWGNCDTHPALCSREYSTSDLVTVPQYRACRREHGCPCSEEGDGSTVIFTFSTFNKQCQNRRFVRLEEQQPVYVYGSVAREYDKLKEEGIDPLRLESIVSSLSQMSSGNTGEATALKRPELEARYWDQMKAFVEHNPKSATPRKVQDLFKRWYKNDPSILPFKGKATPLEPVTGDFKVCPLT
jgi:hypothetical protein